MWRSFFRLLFCLFFIFSISIAFTADSLPIAGNDPLAPQLENLQQELPAEPVSYQAAFMKMILTLVALIFLIFLSVWMLRRIARGRLKQHNHGRGIKILERRPLSTKSILYLIEVNGKKILISESQLEVRPLGSVDEIAKTPEEE